MNKTVRISLQAAPAAGEVRSLGRGDALKLCRSATLRDDWGTLSGAVMAAFSRGAAVLLVDDIDIAGS